mgnify:CR=1 FL=1
MRFPRFHFIALPPGTSHFTPLNAALPTASGLLLLALARTYAKVSDTCGEASDASDAYRFPPRRIVMTVFGV